MCKNMKQEDVILLFGKSANMPKNGTVIIYMKLTPKLCSRVIVEAVSLGINSVDKYRETLAVNHASAKSVNARLS